MMDMKENEKRERVIKGLECIVSSGNAGMRDDCANCVYPGGGDCLAPALQDALALLKTQEQIAPIENAGFYYCGACKCAFTVHRQKYCSECGRAVKWE